MENSFHACFGSGQVDSSAATTRVDRLTQTIWPWIPRHGNTFERGYGNEIWLQYIPPGTGFS